MLQDPIIGAFRILPPCNVAMMQKQQPLRLGLRLMGLCRASAQLETGPDVIDQRQPVAKQFAHHPGRIGQVGQHQHGGCVGVVDETMRQIGVQQRFHRGGRRGGVDQVGAQRVDHVCIADSRQRPQPAQGGQPHRRHAARLDLRQIPARPLDMDHLHRLAVKIAKRKFQRGVAAAMHHKVGGRPDKPRGIDPEGQRPRGRVGARSIFAGAGLRILPSVRDHLKLLCRRRAKRSCGLICPDFLHKSQTRLS